MPQPVGNPRDERRLGPDHREVDLNCLRELQQPIAVVSAQAKIYVKFSGKLEINTELEAQPQGGPGLVLGFGGELGAEVGLLAELSSYVKLHGRINTSVKLESKIKFAPFNWTVGADLQPGVGTVSAAALGFTTGKKWTLWGKTTLMKERTIL